MKTLFGLLKEIWMLFIEMSPYLILGFGLAGVLHVIIPKEKVFKHLSGKGILSIIKASIFGLPLPLCSCGVIPVAAHLRKNGASKLSTLSFLISTPTTGIDSLLATYSLLGLLFAIIRPIAALVTSILSGIIGLFFLKNNQEDIQHKVFNGFSCNICNIKTIHSHSTRDKIKRAFIYGFSELIIDIRKWLIIGILIGGIIGYLVPSNIFGEYILKKEIAYLLMLFLSIPIYVCATGSIPIAASLIAKGITPGAVLVFLIAGPATNTTTISFVWGKLGKKILFIYLFSIIFISVIFGLIIDYIWYFSGENMILFAGSKKILPLWFKTASGIILLILLLGPSILIRNLKIPIEKVTSKSIIIKVRDMNCLHCVRNIDENLRKLNGVKNVKINLKKKEVEIFGDVELQHIISAIKSMGYSPEE